MQQLSTKMGAFAERSVRRACALRGGRQQSRAPAGGGAAVWPANARQKCQAARPQCPPTPSHPPPPSLAHLPPPRAQRRHSAPNSSPRAALPDSSGLRTAAAARWEQDGRLPHLPARPLPPSFPASFRTLPPSPSDSTSLPDLSGDPAEL